MKFLFSKNLSTTDEKHKLSIPCKKLKNFPYFKGGKATDFKAKDVTDGKWHPFRISIRKKGRYFKPVLSKASWQAYAQSKALKKENLVSFSIHSDQITSGISATTTYVQACTHQKHEACRKRIKLLGQVMDVCTECKPGFL